MKKIFSSTLLLAAILVLAPLSSSAQFINTVAGGGSSGLGDGGLADSAQLYYPQGLAVNAAGDMYIADTYHHRIRRVAAATGIITTIAGTGTGGYSGDNGPADSAQVNSPVAVALDAAGNVYIADYANHRVRKITVATGIITTIAGTATNGYNGDSIAAISAELNDPSGLAIDSAGDVYIADAGNQRVRRIDATSLLISTVAGGGTSNPGDSLLATAAELFGPQGLTIGPGGTLYIADGVSNRIRMVDPVSHIIYTIGGMGHSGYSGDGGPAILAELNAPYGLILQDTTLYIADAHNNRIRAIGLPTGIIQTVVGDGTGNYSGDGGYSYNAEVFDPTALAQDGAGNLYIADYANFRIREVSDLVTGIVGIAAQSGISLYPNPTTGSFILNTAESIGRDYTIYDMIGTVIAQGRITSGSQQISLHAASGTYLLSVAGASRPLRFVVE